MRKIALSLVCGIVTLLVACGDTNETTNNILEDGTLDLVADLDSLPECTTDNEGAYVWVKSENELRVCSEEEWTIIGSGASCSTEALQDGSGMKIVCNGDSIGVVLNGKDGSDGKDGANGKDLKDTAAADSEAVATSLDSITGYSQKGPFLKGTPVSVRGLENGRTLTQSNITYEGKIGSDDGEFKLRGGMLKSQYVSLTATGFYKNEVTGENSESQITLNALTDLTTHTSANLNLLTHLEYDRVYHLVKNMGERFATAKKQAQKEIFAAFHIDSKDFKSSEDLNIAGSSEADAALLAVSIMMQRDGSVSQLSDFITGFAANLEKDGTWDDESMRKVIADWAMNADLDGRLSDFRANVKSWKLSDSVPAFEKYVTRFWQTEFKLDGCTEANDGVVVAKGVPNNDDDKDRLICDAGAWRLATDFEKDTYGWEAGAAGERRLGKVNNDVYYVFEEGKWWRTAEGMEVHFGGCTVERDGELKTYNNYYYVCHKDSLKWASATTFEMDTYGWKPGKDADVRNGSVNDAYVYVFDGNAWRRGSETDSTYGIGGCTAARKDTVAKSTNGSYYICRATGWEAATDFEKDTYGWKPGKDGDAKKGNVDSNSVYVFVGEKNAWRRGSDLEDILGLGCTSSKEGNIAQDSAEKKWYICRDRAWQSAKPIEYDTCGWPHDAFDGTVRTGNVDTNSVYVFDSLGTGWRTGDQLDITLGFGGCTALRNMMVDSNGGSFYTCDNRHWRSSKDIEKDTLGWGRLNTTFVEGDVRNGAVNADFVYVYNGASWRRGTVVDFLMKNAGGFACTEKIKGDTSFVKVDDLYYVCAYDPTYKMEDTTYHWIVAPELYNDTHEEPCKFDYIVLDGAIRPITSYEGNLLYGRINQENHYVCDTRVAGSYDSTDYYWRLMTTVEELIGVGCTGSHIGETTEFHGELYSCTRKGVWVHMNDWNWDVPAVSWLNNSGSIIYGTWVDSSDNNKVYKTVELSSGIWMAQNLNRETETGSWCYDDRESNCLAGGRLYTYEAALNACPRGWHLPNSLEFMDLMESDIDKGTARIGKSKKGWHDGENGTDNVGFSVVPAGQRSSSTGKFMDAGMGAYFWTSTLSKRSSKITSEAISWNVFYFNTYFLDEEADIMNGYSVRCVKDAE